ncbi:MAG: ATP-binding protein, partial [Methylobacterium sp.]
RQILLNLLSNASKFTKNGSVTLSVRMDRKPTGTWLDVRVRDSGIGIAPDNIGRLFQNFRQVSAATAQHYGGTGLGLALSQKLCTLMGGSIGVTSELERGSVFSFCIPAEVAETQPDTMSTANHALVPAALGVQFR